MLSDEKKKELVRRARTLLLGGEVLDISAGQVIGTTFLPGVAVSKIARVEDVQIEGSFGANGGSIWMSICVGHDQVYAEHDDVIWDHEDKQVHALEALRRSMILDDLSKV